jgi:anaerobic magnesium-protoporphyrin IX monomethyl ester cyclase
VPDLLLTHGYFLYEDPKELQIMKPYAPLGLLYLCSHLRAQGFDVDVFDTTFSSRDLLFHHLRTECPGVLGVYANLMTRRNVVEILRAARDAGWHTVVGGPEPGSYVHEYLSAGADLVVSGEGELTLAEILHVIRANGHWSPETFGRIHGVAFLDANGAMQQTPARAQIADLDAQPWPARDAIDIDRYVRTWRDVHGQGSVSVITARGCPYKCRWCSHQVFGHTHRRRNPALVVDEIEWLLGRYHPEMLWIADDVFTIHHGWIRAYASEMRRRNLRIPFECISRADRLNEEIMDVLAELGCFRVWIGSESGSQRLLDAMERGVQVEQVQHAVELARSRGIQSGMFLMWGYEGEELQDIEATIDHVKKSNPDIFFTTVAYPIKGTPYYNTVAERVRNGMPWTESSDREFRIAGRHSRRYYEYADRLLRDEVALARHSRSGAHDALTAADLQNRIQNARHGLLASYSEVEA